MLILTLPYFSKSINSRFILSAISCAVALSGTRTVSGRPSLVLHGIYSIAFSGIDLRIKTHHPKKQYFRAYSSIFLQKTTLH